MQTDCIPNLFGFEDLGSRTVVAGFDGGMISSDTGGLLLREVAIATDLLRQFSNYFLHYRNQQPFFSYLSTMGHPQPVFTLNNRDNQ
jgi:hypothetical protein